MCVQCSLTRRRRRKQNEKWMDGLFEHSFTTNYIHRQCLTEWNKWSLSFSCVIRVTAMVNNINSNNITFINFVLVSFASLNSSTKSTVFCFIRLSGICANTFLQNHMASIRNAPIRTWNMKRFTARRELKIDYFHRVQNHRIVCLCICERHRH